MRSSYRDLPHVHLYMLFTLRSVSFVLFLHTVSKHRLIKVTGNPLASCLDVVNEVLNIQSLKKFIKVVLLTTEILRTTTITASSRRTDNHKSKGTLDGLQFLGCFMAHVLAFRKMHLHNGIVILHACCHQKESRKAVSYLEQISSNEQRKFSPENLPLMTTMLARMLAIALN